MPVLVAPIIRRPVWPNVYSIAVEHSVSPLPFVSSSILISHLASPLRHEVSTVNGAYINFSIRVNYFSVLDGEVIKIYDCFSIALGWLFDHQSACNGFRVFPNAFVKIQTILVGKGTCPFCPAFWNFALVFEPCWDELNFAISVGLQVEFAFVEILLGTVQKSIPNRRAFFPVTPIILIKREMFHDFSSVKLLWIVMIQILYWSNFYARKRSSCGTSTGTNSSFLSLELTSIS